MTTLLLGIAGPARGGKTTVANHLRDEFGFYTYAFAEPMKHMLSQLLALTPEQLEQRKDELLPWLGFSPRHLLQTLGTEWGRETLHPDFWIRIATDRIRWLENYETGLLRVVIGDVRFENEAAFIRRQGGFLIHVRRDDVAPVRAHASEAGVEVQDNDLVLVNNGTLAELHASIDALLHRIANRRAAQEAA